MISPAALQCTGLLVHACLVSSLAVRGKVRGLGLVGVAGVFGGVGVHASTRSASCCRAVIWAGVADWCCRICSVQVRSQALVLSAVKRGSASSTSTSCCKKISMAARRSSVVRVVGLLDV